MENEYPQDQARATLANAIASAEPTVIADALLAVVNGDPDWAWLEEQCLELLVHSDVDVRGLAATSLGHVVRLHGRLHVSAIHRLRDAQLDPAIAGRVEDALADIETFLIDEPVD